VRRVGGSWSPVNPCPDSTPPSHRSPPVSAARCAQALTRGSAGAIKRRLGSGAWEGATSRVYLLRGTPDCWLRRLWIGVLDAGTDAAVGGIAAAAMHGLPGFKEGSIEVIRPARSHRAGRFGFVYESLTLGIDDVSPIGSLPVLTVARTLVELSRVITARR